MYGSIIVIIAGLVFVIHTLTVQRFDYLEYIDAILFIICIFWHVFLFFGVKMYRFYFLKQRSRRRSVELQRKPSESGSYTPTEDTTQQRQSFDNAENGVIFPISENELIDAEDQASINANINVSSPSPRSSINSKSKSSSEQGGNLRLENNARMNYVNYHLW